jgi:hypothetical protein
MLYEQLCILGVLIKKTKHTDGTDSTDTHRLKIYANPCLSSSSVFDCKYSVTNNLSLAIFFIPIYELVHSRL